MSDCADAVRAERATELERLGSDRGLIALTDADLSAATIRERFASVLLAVAEVYDQWGESDDVFADATVVTRDLVATVADESTIEPATGHPLVAHLSGLDERGARLGAGLIAAPAILDGWALQGVSFFVNEADEGNADRFREVRSELDDLVAAGEDSLDDDQRAAAVAAGSELVTVAYEDYVETLEGMGLDPKTVC